MTETVLHPEVRDFVEQVRHHLRDLPADERDELTDGLEADLAELVTERGSEALGDPSAYAAELRAAAGLERRRRPRRLSGATALLDRSRARWDRVVAVLPGDVAGFLSTVRPVWWVVRAWVAVELVDLWFGGYPHSWIPAMLGPVGWAVLLVAVVVSVQLGRGLLPLGPVRGLPRRLGLLVLNLFAVVMLLPVAANLPRGTDLGDDSALYVVPHLAFNSNSVENVYPYDANGQPLTGVQLLDQNGQRLSVASTLCGSYWTNGTKRVFSAFPVPARSYDQSTGRCTGPATISFPLASLPPVALPAAVAAAVAGTTP